MAAPGTPNAVVIPSRSSTWTAASIALILAIAFPRSMGDQARHVGRMLAAPRRGDKTPATPVIRYLEYRIEHGPAHAERGVRGRGGGGEPRPRGAPEPGAGGPDRAPHARVGAPVERQAPASVDAPARADGAGHRLSRRLPATPGRARAHGDAPGRGSPQGTRPSHRRRTGGVRAQACRGPCAI